jgi:hypothetical protein
MFVQLDGTGQRGFVFHTDGSVVLFVTIDQKADASGSRYLPVSRVQFGTGSQFETIPVLSGTCGSVDPVVTWRAEATCEAETTKGHFAAQFVTIDAATEPVKPDERP